MKWCCILFFSVIFLISTGCRKVNDDCNTNLYPNAPSKTWQSEVQGSGEESHGHYIMSCSDGGYLQVGETGFIPNSAKILVVKTDNNGNLIWKKEFSNGGNNLGNSAIEISDGYLICGAINENSTIIKLDKNDGSELFNHSIDNGGNDAFEHITVTSEGIIAVGYINAQDNTNTFFTEGEGYITFLDLEGTVIHGININNYMSHAYRIDRLDNGFIISGLTEDARDYSLIKTDSQGNIIWNKTYGGAESDHCFGMDVADDQSIFLTGHSLSGTENWDTYTMKIDTDGNQIWETTVGNPRGFNPKFIHDEAWGIKSTPDGGCIIVAGTGDEYRRYKKNCGNDGDNSNTWHVYLVKFDINGYVEWEKTYWGDQGVDWAGEDIDITIDGGAIIAVDNGNFGFLKIEPFL